MPVARVQLQVPYGSHLRHRFDLVVPEGGEDKALVVCLHGGWWAHGRHEDLRGFCLALAEHGFASASVGTRGPLDAIRGQDIVSDLAEAVPRVLEEAALSGMDGRSLVLLGSGSGSLMALLLAARLATDHRSRLRAVIAAGVTPSLDPADIAAPHALKAIEQVAGADRAALSAFTAPPASFPPLLLLHGDGDGEVPAKAATRFHQRQVDAGETSTLTTLAGVGHQFIEQPQERGGKIALEKIVAFLREHAVNPVEPVPECAPTNDER